MRDIDEETRGMRVGAAACYRLLSWMGCCDNRKDPEPGAVIPPPITNDSNQFVKKCVTFFRNESAPVNPLSTGLLNVPRREEEFKI